MSRYTVVIAVANILAYAINSITDRNIYFEIFGLVMLTYIFKSIEEVRKKL